jgi:hypothetical protein
MQEGQSCFELNIILEMFFYFLRINILTILVQFAEEGRQLILDEWTRLTKYFFSDTGIDDMNYFCRLESKKH